MGGRSLHNGRYLYLAIVFICCVLVVIAGSLLWRLAAIYMAKDFDGKSQFILEINGNKSSESSEIVIFSPNYPAINIVSASRDDLQKFTDIVGVPIDKKISGIVDGNKMPNLWNSNLNIFDKFQLWLFAKSLRNNQFSYSEIKSLDDQKGIDKILTLFIDKKIYTDGETITVINAGDISGEGSKVGKLLSNIGANVISVSTADNTQVKTSIQYYGDKSYTVERLEHLFKVKSVQLSMKNNPVADILLIIGEDYKD